MAVPLVDLRRQHEPLMPRLRESLDQVVKSGHFVLGPHLEAFEKDLAAYCGVPNAVGVSSGTDALLVSLMACDIGPGDEVITTPFTFFSTAGSIARLGARPVFVDIDPVTYNIDPQRVEDAVTEATKAIIAVHLFGQTADMATILPLAQTYGLMVIEDAAQAIGANDGQDRAGALGDIGCFSFYPTKNLAAMGDGGACTIQDKALAQRIQILRDHGQGPRYQYGMLGGNFRLDALQAGILGVKLKYLEQWTSARRQHAAQYRQQLSHLPIGLPTELEGKRHVYNQFTIRVEDGRRDALQAHLMSRQISSQVHYPRPLHLQDCFADLGYKRGDLPVSERAADEVLSLPMFAELTPAEQEEVAGAISEFF